MNKKIFGIKIGTVITVIASLAAAILVWLFVRYSEAQLPEALKVLVPGLVRGI